VDVIQVFGVINYLNDADALDRGEDTLRRIRWEFYTYQEMYHEWTISPSNPGGDAIDVVVAWDRWYLDYMDTRIKKARSFLLEWCNEGLEHFDGMTDSESKTVVAILELYLDRAHGIGGYNDLGYPKGPPTPP
jgi:hypothetical protein